ncbi:MAG: NAD(P)/FAD-dependent oxidoreductase [Candidatus Thorarchaeota archaeon]|nr:NAD(P)/FAD-dependent oxidoreductase [Candidatus Thorarchaeota archaeon]
MSNRDFDVIVIGGGPAGSATAISLASEGKEVLLVEKGSRNRYKPCGGVLPLVAPEMVEDIVGESIPDDVRVDPAELGLYYVPPSGRDNSGRVKNYSIHNIDRAQFDQWLRDLAENAGAIVKHDSRCIDIAKTDNYKIVIDSSEEKTTARADFIVGADGVRSSVRQKLFPEKATPMMIVEQEHWEPTGDFEDCFYGFFRGNISISYAYLIPKADSLIIGLGAVPHQEPNVAQLLIRLRAWLEKEFSFVPKQLLKKEAWSIPFGYFVPGEGNVLLVGDAAGLCNPLSGEGIRLAVESAEAASSAILAADGQKNPIVDYARDIRGLSEMIKELNEFVRTVDDNGREKFVRDELSRGG